MSIWVYPYKQGSKSARDLARAIRARVIKKQNSRFRPTMRKVVINWGSSVLPDFMMGRSKRVRWVLNQADAVACASNKLATFKALEGRVRTPRWTTNLVNALDWEKDFCARQVLTGHSARGMVYCSREDEDFPNAPLYTEYVKKKDEYRVHIVHGGIILVQKKMKRRDIPNEQINYRIRNLEGGFIYATDPVNIGDVPVDVQTQALAASTAIGMDFCAVDVIWNNHKQEAYVLEVNSAPGLTGNTLDFYAAAFLKIAS